MTKENLYLPTKDYHNDDLIDLVNEMATSIIFENIEKEEKKHKYLFSNEEKINSIIEYLNNNKEQDVIDFFTEFELFFHYSLNKSKRKFVLNKQSLIQLKVYSSFDHPKKERIGILGSELDDFHLESYNVIYLSNYEEFFNKFIEINFNLIIKICHFVVFEYFISLLEKLNVNKVITPTTNQTKKTSLPLQIALLNEIGFFELEYFKTISNSKRNEVIAKILNSNARSVKGNVSALDPNSNENLSKYTSFNYMEEVKLYLSKL